jgi:hypothetical protein
MKSFIKIGIFATILLVISSSCGVQRGAEKQFSKLNINEPYDVVIVPGAPVGDENLGSILAARIAWSKYLFDSGFTKNVIYSGAAVETPYIEGVAMKTYAEYLGLPAANTFAETKAEHSTENIYNGVKLARKLGFKKIALATDPFQNAMLSSFMKRRLKDVGAIPIVFRRIFKDKNEYNELPKVNVEIAHVDENEFIPLHARESFFKRLAGTFGSNIPKDDIVLELPDNKYQAHLDTIPSK